MNVTQERWIRKAYDNPRLRGKIVNKGLISLYCDYSGFVDRSLYSVACCFVHNRAVSVSAKKLLTENDGGSNYGELLAILYSLEILANTLHVIERQPKIAIVYTDCSQIERILKNSDYLRPDYACARNEILVALDELSIRYSGVKVWIKYISKHKANNALHRLAHNAAREAAMV